MIIHTMPQRSEEWYAVRSGKFTASDFEALMPSAKQGMNDWNKTQMSIIYRVAAERMTNAAVCDSYISKAMQHGIDTEAEARISFMLEAGLDIQEVGFVEYSEWIGCSPDGLGVNQSDPGLEIKCPNSDTHLRYYFNREDLINDYKYQCLGGMLCTGRNAWYLYSYDPRFADESKKSVLVMIQRDEAEMQKLIDRLVMAIRKVQEMIA